MKTKILSALLLMSTMVMAQAHHEKITKEFVFEKRSSANAIIVENINGDVKVVGYDGDKILLELDKSITAKTEARLETGKKELKLGVIDRADTVILYVEDGCNSFGKRNRNKDDDDQTEQWGYNWNCNNHCHLSYDYKTSFLLKVPRGVNVVASTVNDGNIVIENVGGEVKADNVNGSISLTNISKSAEVSTINGDVDVDYSVNPLQECRFYTLNGDINAIFQKGLAANLSFESFNGDFYTNVNEIKPLPAQIQKAETGNGIKYKVSGNRYQVGQGGVSLDFETFNGNVYLKEK
jgi:DUF4097 and DUF4098 domain-containing protein YvlB